MDGGYTGQDTKRERIQVPCVETQEGWGGFEKGGRVVHTKKKTHEEETEFKRIFIVVVSFDVLFFQKWETKTKKKFYHFNEDF